MDTKIIFNDKKFREAVLYLLAHSPNGTIEGKKKLAKLLYFVDFNFFEAFEKPFTGATYKALPMGPFPKELENAIGGMKKEVQVANKKTGLPNDTVVYILNVNPSGIKFNLTGDEKKVLDKVLNDYGRLSGTVLEDITHSEAPYNAVVEGDQIPYELSFYRGKTTEELLGR